MIKYQCANKRIGDTITIEQFMSSLLKHAIHPDQFSKFFIHSQKVSFSHIIWLVLSQYAIKVSYEALMSPLSVQLSLWLKSKEKIDIYDVQTDFSIFKLSINELEHENRYFST